MSDEAEIALEREKNEKILTTFKKLLKDSGLKDKTIKKHIDNVSFYINEYLLYYDCIPATEGITSINGFFDWFFPKKAMWSSRASTKETVSSLKKFYKHLTSLGIIEESDYLFLLSEVKSCMEFWLEEYDEEDEW